MVSESYSILNGRKCKRKCLSLRASICLAVSVILLPLIVIFVIIPISFMLSFPFQASIMFTRFNLPTDPKTFIPKQIGIKNYYVSVNDIETNETVKLGVWHLLPWQLVNVSRDDPNFDYDMALADGQFDVLIHFHGTGETRIDSYKMFSVLREFFHVIAFDYRGYGDSSRGKMTENAVVEDCRQLSKWVRSRTSANIYFWGHSLGASLATTSIARLRDDDMTPTGLFLEAAFTTMREEIPCHPYGKIFAWLPWFEGTILNPLERNGFHFNNSDNILQVNCPVMIFHAEDDSIIPFKLGEKLADGALKGRNVSQGDVTYHQIPALFKCDHFYLYNYPYLAYYISVFLNTTSTNQSVDSQMLLG